MRRSRTATTALTCLIGLGSIVSLAIPANAESPAQSTNTKISSTGGHGDPRGPIVAYPTTPTTKPELPKAPAPDADYDDLVVSGYPTGPTVHPQAPEGGQQVIDPSGGQNDPCAPVASCPQDGECRPGSTVDPDCRPEDDCIPSTTNVPNPCEEDDCTPIPGANNPCDEPECVPSTTNVPNPCEEDECDPIARDRGDCDEPCEQRPPTSPRDRGEDCDDPCIEDDDRPTQPRVNDSSGSTGGTDRGTTGGTDGPIDRPGVPERCPGTGTTGGTDGGTDGETRLPRTGTEIMTIAGMGAALTGIGAALKKLSKRAAKAA